MKKKENALFMLIFGFLRLSALEASVDHRYPIIMYRISMVWTLVQSQNPIIPEVIWLVAIAPEARVQICDARGDASVIWW